MAHVTVNYKMLLPGGHHRQPRNTTIELTLAQQAGADVATNGHYTPPFFPQLPYTLNGVAGMAKLLFWNITDGTTGKIRAAEAVVDEPIGGVNTTITAWYWPISGPESSGHAIFDDAFSAAMGRFIDDTFVDVPGNAALTTQANVTGTVSTDVAVVTLVAKNTVPSTSEPFYQWILNGAMQDADEAKLTIPRGSDGTAIAVYQKHLSFCRQPLHCMAAVCPAAIVCDSKLQPPPQCKADLVCKNKLDVCKSGIACIPKIDIGCKAGIGPGCRAIDPVDEDILGRIIREAGLRDIKELAQKLTTSKVKNALAKLDAAQQKRITLMLKQIEKG